MPEPVLTPDYVLNPPSPRAGETGARCAAHPDAAATGNCSRCGTFFCATDAKFVLGRWFCGSCALRPDVNYLEAYRLKYWGKRDSWGWLWGVSAIANLAVSVPLLLDGQIFWGLYALIGTAVGGCYWLGIPAARFASLFMPIILFAAGILTRTPERASIGIVPFLVAVSVFFDTRNRLFFKVPVSEARLQKSWDLYANNQLARTGLVTGFASLLIPPFAPIGLACSIIGLGRVDPDAHPPIGKRVHAIAGIVLSSIGLIELCAAVFFLVTAKFGG